MTTPKKEEKEVGEEEEEGRTSRNRKRRKERKKKVLNIKKFSGGWNESIGMSPEACWVPRSPSLI